jgi:hypothetical protein
MGRVIGGSGDDRNYNIVTQSVNGNRGCTALWSFSAQGPAFVVIVCAVAMPS